MADRLTLTLVRNRGQIAGVAAVCIAGAGWLSPLHAQTSAENEAAAADQPATVAPDDASSPAAETTIGVVTPDLPTEEELQSRGARIGAIEVQVDNVFDPANPKESGALYRAANFLHIKTRESTVRPQLLFKSGDDYSQHVLDETARNLRARRYLADASAVPLRYHPDTNTVDVLVRVRDVWTLNPGTTFGRSGGQNHSGFQLEEQNLLGLGKAVEIQRSQNVDRSAWEFSYRDLNFLSTRWAMTADYRNASDGGSKSLDIEHPFFALDTRYSGALSVMDVRRMDRRFEQGVVVDQYLTHQRTSSVQAGWSTGLQGSGTQWVLRSTLAYQTDDLTYAVDPVQGTTMLPQNQRLRFPSLNLSWFQDYYVVTRNRERIERTEDMFMGRAAGVTLGYASKAFDSDRNALIVGVNLQDAYQFGMRQDLFVSWNMSGRYEQGQWRNTIYTTGLRYDWRENNRYLLAVKFNHAYAQDLDDSQQLYLGSDEGLRGYPLRYRSGNERSVLNIEQRFYSTMQILRLLSVGAAAYVDVGRIGGETGTITDTQRTFADVGMGLRLGNIRSSGGEMFHFDVAWPFNAPAADRKVQFSIVTKTTF